MLYGPEDNKNNSSDNKEKLIHADSDNERLTDDVKANENSLFGKEPDNRPDHGHDSLFESSFDDDDLVSSSFAISFKANDPGSVSDMLKEDHNSQPATNDLAFEDDLADFEFDSSVSAFKPIANVPAPEHVDNKKTEKIPEPPIQQKPVETKAADPFEGIDDVTPPKFTDDDKDFLELAGMNDAGDDNLFKSGEDLDFATSSKDQAESPFAHAQKPEEPKAKDIDIPSSHIAEEESNAKIESFGKVESGVNAFKKKGQEPKAEAKPEPVNEVKEQATEAPAAAAAAAVIASAEKPEVKSSPAAAPRSSTPTSPNTRPAARPLAQAQPIKAEFDEEKTSRVRPGTNDAMQKKADRANKSSAKIAPVSQVSSKKRKDPKSKKDPGKGGLITLAVVIVVFLGIFLILDNIDKITAAFKGDQPVTTVETSRFTTTTVESTEASTTSTTEATTKATTATTTEATTVATTEATTATTTEATTATTTEATTTATTTEATTTAATTAQTTSGSSTGVRVKNLSTSVKHFKSTSNGFSFDVVITNKTKNDASLSASLNYFKIKLYANKTIKNLTSNGFTFSRSGNTFTCKPIDTTIPAGKTVTIKVTVTTSGKPTHFGYNQVVFKMK